MNYGELERMTTKQLRCTLYDCRDKKYIPYRCLLPTGIWKLNKMDLIMLILSLEYFIPTCIVVENKYDRVRKQLLVNYLYSKVEYRGSRTLSNKNVLQLNTILESELGDNSYNVLQYAISKELIERANKRSILPYVDKIDIVRRLEYHLKVTDEIWSLDRDDYWFTLRNPWRPY